MTLTLALISGICLCSVVMSLPISVTASEMTHFHSAYMIAIKMLRGMLFWLYQVPFSFQFSCLFLSRYSNILVLAILKIFLALLVKC
jgi:hypothetical protein